jgi:hypothetical protein
MKLGGFIPHSIWVYPFFMLNLVAYRKLSNPDYMPEVALRMFMSMLCDFELSHFRAISLHRLVELYGFNEKRQARRLNLLLDLGLLETGSMVVDEVEGKIVETRTYRVPERLLLTKEDLMYWDRDIRHRRGREQLLAVAPSLPASTAASVPASIPDPSTAPASTGH